MVELDVSVWRKGMYLSDASGRTCVVEVDGSVVEVNVSGWWKWTCL